MRKVIQLTRDQLDTLDAIVAEISLFYKQQAMTWDLLIEQREAEQAEMDKFAEQEEMRNYHYKN